MKLNVDFSALEAQVRAINAPEVHWKIETQIKPRDSIEWQGGTIEIQSLDDIQVDPETRLLTKDGKPCILYIPYNSNAKYHVYRCQTIKVMKNGGRYDRYTITDRTDGRFEMKDGDFEELMCCQHCINMLPYDQKEKLGIRKNNYIDYLNLPKFFEYYGDRSPLSTEPKPRYQSVREMPKDGYTEDWNEISKNLRERKNWTCEKCKVNLQDHQNLLHVNHKNGVKGDNRPENLNVLCVRCHSNEPNHHHMKGNPQTRQQIETVRKIQLQQGVIRTTENHQRTNFETERKRQAI